MTPWSTRQLTDPFMTPPLLSQKMMRWALIGIILCSTVSCYILQEDDVGIAPAPTRPTYSATADLLNDVPQSDQVCVLSRPVTVSQCVACSYRAC